MAPAHQDLTNAAVDDGLPAQETPAATEPARPSDDPPQNPAALAIRHDAEVCEAEMVDDDPASEISRLHGEIEGSLRVSVNHAIRIGELLAAQKAKLGHGRFLPWIKTNPPFTERTAQKYMQVYSGQASLKCESGSYLTTAYRLTAPKAKAKTGKSKAKSSEDKGSNKAKPKQNTEETTATTDARTDDNQKDQTQADGRPDEKPTTQADEAGGDPTSSSASEDKSGDDQTDHHQDATHAKADTSSASDPEAAPPDIMFEDALAVVMRTVRENNDDFAVKVLDHIATERDFLTWVRTGKGKAYRENLAQVVDQIVDEGLRADAKATTRWARSLVQQVRSQLGDSDD